MLKWTGEGERTIARSVLDDAEALALDAVGALDGGNDAVSGRGADQSQDDASRVQKHLEEGELGESG